MSPIGNMSNCRAECFSAQRVHPPGFLLVFIIHLYLSTTTLVAWSMFYMFKVKVQYLYFKKIEQRRKTRRKNIPSPPWVPDPHRSAVRGAPGKSSGETGETQESSIAFGLVKLGNPNIWFLLVFFAQFCETVIFLPSKSIWRTWKSTTYLDWDRNRNTETK